MTGVCQMWKLMCEVCRLEIVKFNEWKEVSSVKYSTKTDILKKYHAYKNRFWIKSAKNACGKCQE